MGMIQQSINQTLSLAGFMYSQTEHAKTQQKARKLEHELGALYRGRELRAEHKGLMPDPETTGEILQKEKELYKIKPTDKRINDIINAEDVHYNETADYKEEMRQIAEIEAMPAEQKAEEEAYYQRQAEEDEAELAERKQLAEASATIQARIKDPFAIADEELQRAVQRKNEIERRKKGGMML